MTSLHTLPKFRVWFPEYALLAPVEDIHWDAGVIETITFWTADTGAEDIKAQSESFVLMQSTGYKDRNGTEIYEGDILDVETSEPENPTISAVIWGWFDDCCIEGFTWRLAEEIYQPSVDSNAEYSLVIGNIYETPSLIPEVVAKA